MDMSQGVMPPQSQPPQQGAIPQQGMLPPQQGAAPAPQQQAPAPQQQAQPGQDGGQSTMIGTPQPERDYEQNPLNEHDKDNIDKFYVMATKLIHTPQTRDAVLSRIKGMDSPHQEIADAAYGVINRVIQEGKKEKKPFDPAVLIVGGTDVVSQVTELALAAGKIKVKPTEQDMKIIAGKVVQKYYKERLATGEITKEQAARDAHAAASAQAAGAGHDTSDVAQRAAATQQMKSAAINAPKVGLSDPNGLQAPQPNDPFKPKATMKETLATGQGGLLG